MRRNQDGRSSGSAKPTAVGGPPGGVRLMEEPGWVSIAQILSGRGGSLVFKRIVLEEFSNAWTGQRRHIHLAAEIQVFRE